MLLLGDICWLLNAGAEDIFGQMRSLPAGGAGWMVTGEGFWRIVVWRGWMMIVLAWRDAAAWVMGSAVMSGLGWMETLVLVWMGLLAGWRGFAVRKLNSLLEIMQK